MRYVRPLQKTAILMLITVTALSATGQANGSTTGASASPAANVTDKVIVVLRDQATSLPDTAADARMRTQFSASTAIWQRFGNLSTHSAALAPGASRMVTLTVSTPAGPGDQAGSIVVTSSASAPVPVTLRTLLPVPDPSESFTASLTGGHPSGPDLGQTLYYQMDVPAGLRALNASISTASAGNTFFAELINPSGQAVSTTANGLPGATVKGVTAIAPETAPSCTC
jgi:hypothetical protein